jgi:hypothetical protein
LKPKFEVEFLPEAADFVESLNPKAREKIYYNIKKASITLDNELFKKLNNNIWEFRTLYNKTVYRLFAFWTVGTKYKTIVITSHGIIKKSDKGYIQEIKKAESIRKAFLKIK